MVNVIDAFTRLYKRPPTEEEIGAMIKMKADMDALQNRKLRPTVNVMEVSKTSRERSKIAAAKRPLKDKILINLRGWTINCLLHEGLSKEAIAEAMCITVGNVEYNINRYKLPRKDVIKPR